MQRMPLLVVAPVLVALALAGCSSGPSADVNAALSQSAAIKTAESQAAAAPSAAASASSDDSSSGNSGTITFTGAVSGTMTVAACDIGGATLAVQVDGASTPTSGLLNTADFTFVDGDQNEYAISPGTKIDTTDDGHTFTVTNIKLVRLNNHDDSVTASGSVTCGDDE